VTLAELTGTDAGIGSPSANGHGERGGAGADRTQVRPLVPEDFAPAAKARGGGDLSRPSLSYWGDAWLRLRRNRQALGSLGIICLLFAFTIFGPLVWRVDPGQQVLDRISEGPSLGRSVTVLPELPPFEDTVAPSVGAVPAPNGAALPAPAALDWMGEPTVQAVRMRWTPVPGAARYLVYRSKEKPSGGYLGLPVGSVDAGNVVSFEDSFNLDPRTYYYSVVAENGSESPHAVTRMVNLSPGLSLLDAQAIRPDARPGDVIHYPARPLGTDYLGRDLLARLMMGARGSLFIGFFAPLFSVLMGVLIGGVAGFLGGQVDAWLMRFTDFVLALPFLLFMILFKVALGAGPGQSGILPMLIALVALSWTGSARLTRGQVLQLRESEFVQASRLLGGRAPYLLVRHLVPNTLGVILVSLTFAIPSAIFTEAFLSFIGMGVVPPTPSWGSMCNDGIQNFLTHPHEFFLPALLICLAVLAFNLLGDGLRDALDPRLRSAR
jgi:oligopeptide transport system permease protein